ncbi:MAG: helix-turn-helix domain-containing protein [Clostridia bacterium]|nr:helix-turn-helix domain-containing protein [Clostridia bacterium]
MKDINIAKNIIALRKSKGITQEQLSEALNISAQAVSKWETGTCQPDTLTLPLIAEYFNVSIDYLYYGKDMTYGELYEKVFQKVLNNHSQMDKGSYEDALRIFGYAHHGISHGNLRGRSFIYDGPAHISNENGISLLSGKGYGAILTRAFFESITPDTVDFGANLLSALAVKDDLLVCMAIISMSDISLGELQEKLNLSKDDLRKALDTLIEAKIVIEKESKHKSLGFTYEINSMYHSCLCILIATIEMLRYGLTDGVSCCMGFGDYPIQFNK